MQYRQEEKYPFEEEINLPDKLQEIKDDVLTGAHMLFGKPWVSMPQENYDWLVKQAEILQKIQEENKRIEEASDIIGESFLEKE